MSVSPPETTDPFRAAKDCMAGTVGGILQVFSGQPFDTVKVRLQTMPRPAPGQPPLYQGTLDCVRQTYRAEGLAGFYKGTTTPLVGVGLCVSIQFLVLEHMKRTFAQHNAASTTPAPLSLTQLYVAGATAGVANSVVSGPVEHIRTRLQVQTGSAASTGTGGSARPFYNGPIDCVRQIYRSHGLPGLFKGQAATIVREFQGYGAYFLAYEYMIQRTMARRQVARDQIAATEVCLYGALAGYAMWGSVYPVDVIKSKLQTDSLVPHQRQYHSVLDCARKTFRSEGVAGFYKGIVPCLLRAAPANAATFIGFELAMRFLK
ncbi:Mitochondrial carrier protein ymc2 [Dimargaris cristalligena]|uniref:Mitochondrial carrier domain-containing protein n=1 Tax=Dimargaris cristalligena TaxID=215637 RepID=A0A4P9ZWW2_9FUNG|nr:Mitochondrial carrier protein ymc2 [Dimargaris cristalligena]RKP38165.1 mitochondrial carrier domain-containing protein [Dimargaris cristalligena]|eukprot:RKP38165.1 mitochondrial carrier domain-containing protein [Dimargaris cristalligena]